jgi:hypothetical protein
MRRAARARIRRIGGRRIIAEGLEAISGTTTSTTTKAAASAATTVYARDLFAAQDVRFGQEYDDIIWIDGHGLRRLDYSKIDSTRPAPAPVESSDSAR